MKIGCNAFVNYFFILLCSTVFVACDDDDDLSSTGNDLDAVSEFLLNDRGLVISLLTDDDEDETFYFDSFVFVFNSDGTVVATKGNETVTGSYSVSRDDGSIELQMNFPDIQNFDELNEDWDFIAIIQNTIRFDDDGDRLEFRRQ